MNYLARNIAELKISRANGPDAAIDMECLKQALVRFNGSIAKLRHFEVDVFGLLGMRNLSSFVGELFCAAIIKESSGQFLKNPHQDGYPDLLLMDPEGRKLWESLEQRRREKEPFSPFVTGGIEVKATVGSLPSAAWFQKRSSQKPDIGDQRIDYLKSYDWKAHHRDTNNLLGLVWDFVDRSPCVVGVFYSHKLTQNHWGKIITPKEGGGRTTSVSIMPRHGVAKMHEGWLIVIDDDRYIDFLNKHNRSTLIQRAAAKSFAVS